MPETKLTNTKVPTMRPRTKIKKKLGLLKPDQRKMVSFRLKMETIELLETMTGMGKKHFYSRFSGADTIELCLSILKDMDKLTLLEKGSKYLSKKDDDVLTR